MAKDFWESHMVVKPGREPATQQVPRLARGSYLSRGIGSYSGNHSRVREMRTSAPFAKPRALTITWA